MVSLSSKRFLLFIVLVQTPALLCMDRVSSLSSPVGSPAAAAAAVSSPAAQAPSLSSAAQVQTLPIENALIKALYSHGRLIGLSSLVDGKIEQALQMLSTCMALPDLTKLQPRFEDFAAATDIAHWLLTHYDELSKFTTPKQIADAIQERRTVLFKGITQELSSTDATALAAQAAASFEPLPQDGIASNSDRAARAAQTIIATQSGISISKNELYREIYHSTLPLELRSSIPSSAHFANNQSTDTAKDAIQFVCSDRMLCFLLRELLITAAHPVPEDDFKRSCKMISKDGVYGIPAVFQRCKSHAKSALQERLFNLIEYYAHYATIDIVQLLEITHEWQRYDLFQAALQFFVVHLNKMTRSVNVSIPTEAASIQEQASLVGEATLHDFAQHLPYHYFDTMVYHPECAPFLLKCLCIKAQGIPLSNTLEWNHIHEAIRASLLALPGAVKTIPTIATLFDGDSAQDEHFRTLLTKEMSTRYPLCCHQNAYINSTIKGQDHFFMNGDSITKITIKDNLITVVTYNFTLGEQWFQDYRSHKGSSLSKQELSAFQYNKTLDKTNVSRPSASKNIELAEPDDLCLDQPLTKGTITTYCSKDLSTQVICCRQLFDNISLLTPLKVVTIKNGTLSESFIRMARAITCCYPLHEKAFLIADSNGVYIINEHGETMRTLDSIPQLPTAADAARLSTNQSPTRVAHADPQATPQEESHLMSSPSNERGYIHLGVKNDCIYALSKDGILKVWRLNQLFNEKSNKIIAVEQAIEPTIIKCFQSDTPALYSIKNVIPLSDSRIALIYDDIYSDESNTIGLFSARDGSLLQCISLSDRSIFESPYEPYAEKIKRFEHIVSINNRCLALADDDDTLYVYNTQTNKVIHVNSYKTGNMRGHITRLFSLNGFLYILTLDNYQNIQVEGLFIKKSASVAHICNLLSALTLRKAPGPIKQRPSRQRHALQILPDDSCQQCIRSLLPNPWNETLKSVHFVTKSTQSIFHREDPKELDCFVGELESNDLYPGNCRIHGQQICDGRIAGKHKIIGGLVYESDRFDLYQEEPDLSNLDKEITISQQPFHITVIDSTHIAFCSQQCVKSMQLLDFRHRQKGVITGQFKWPRNILGMACVKGVQLANSSEEKLLLIVDEAGAYLIALDGTVKQTLGAAKDTLTSKAPKNDADTNIENPVVKMAFDHTLLILAYANKCMKVWNLTNCQEIGHIQPTINSTVQDSSHLPVTALSILSPFSIFVTYANNVARIYDLNTLNFSEFVLLIGETKPVCIHEIRKDLIAIWCMNGDVHVFDAVKKDIVKTIPSKGHYYPIKIMMDQRLLKIIYSDGTGEDWCMPEFQ